VTLEDLSNDDRDLWHRYHAGKCTGIAEGDVAGSGRKSYAIALLQNDAEGNLHRQLIVWLPTGTSFSKIVLVRPAPVVADPFVVWMAPPGKSHEWDGGPATNITHESFVYAKMEAIAWQFYLLSGRFHSLQTAN
jgi:hypothetical protein